MKFYIPNMRCLTTGHDFGPWTRWVKTDWMGMRKTYMRRDCSRCGKVDTP